jgi:Flp pilus assembly protein TadG
MRSRLRQLGRDERGMTFVFVGIGFMGFMAATTLAIDVGMFMTARSQAQNAADSGALAGAVALAFNDFNDRSNSGPAVQSALSASRANSVMREQVSVTADDVTFPQAPSGQNNRVRVTVRRAAERSNAIPTFIGPLFGLPSVDIMATATAEAAPANAMTCVKPFIIPDKWRETQSPPWDSDDTFEMYDNKGRLLANPDVYVPATQSGYTGYNQESDRGRQLVIRAGSGNNINPTFYYSLAMNNETGGSDYRWNIANCNTSIVRMGDLVIQEPGNMVGPTIQGAEELIARDPGAYWDTAKNGVITSMHPSPRVFPIPLYDPVYYAEGKAAGRYADFKVANWIGFFLDRVASNQLYGRIIPIAGILDSNGPTPEAGGLPRAIRLVE